MDEAVISTLLADAGVADTAAASIGATIRPRDVTAGNTLAAPGVATGRPLPRMSIDLRDASRPHHHAPSAADLEVVGVIGEGGMGRVFLARQHSLERDVAVKTAKDGSRDSAREAILVEGTVTGRLEHPAIVPVHALGVDEAGRPMMVMKRVEGVGWDALLRAPTHAGWEGWDGEPDDRLAGHLQILSQICNALHFAHSRGFVHRDVKPENVLIGRFGDVYLADWGIAAELGAREARLCGTPGYMAPEMVGGGTLDARTDVYLLGATLHEILTGAQRHRAPTVLAALVSAKLSEPHAYGAGVPDELAALANDACSADPAARPQTATEFRAAIARYLTHRQSVALADEARGRLGQLEAALAVEDPSDAMRREIDRLLVEARFGLEQALAQWSGNAPARGALDRLEAIDEARRARAAELERQARERDPTIAARPRAVALSALGVLGVLMGVYALTAQTRPPPILLVAFAGIMWVAVLGGALVFRRSVLATEFNRQGVGLLLVAVGLLVVGRVLGLLVDIDIAQHFARDSFVMAGVLGAAGLAYMRWAYWVALVFLAAGVGCTLYPERALQAFGLAASFAVILVAVFAWRVRR